MKKQKGSKIKLPRAPRTQARAKNKGIYTLRSQMKLQGVSNKIIHTIKDKKTAMSKKIYITHFQMKKEKAERIKKTIQLRPKETTKEKKRKKDKKRYTSNTQKHVGHREEQRTRDSTLSKAKTTLKGVSPKIINTTKSE